MGFINEARVMLDAADKAAGSKELQVGWLTLAKDTISAALTEAKKGVKSQDGHAVTGQTALEDFAGAPIGAAAKVDGNGVVITPADERDPDDGEDGGEAAEQEPTEGDPEDRFAAVDQFMALPQEDFDMHKTHVAADPESVEAGCPVCDIVRAARAGYPQHGRPDQGDTIPRIGDSRGIPDGDGAQVVPA